MNKKQKKQARVAMAVALAATSVVHSTGSIFAQSESTMEELNPVDTVENTESIEQVERAVGDVEINDKNFPDAAFRQYISTQFDIDKDGILSSDEITNITRIRVSSNKNVTSVEGIEYFPNLESLVCYQTNITTLDVSKNTALTSLDCSYTGITELDVSKNTALISLNCDNTGITELDVSKNIALTNLDCGYTGITELDVSKNTALTNLDCGYTGITELDVSKNTALTSLDCNMTVITELDVSKNIALEYLACSGNRALTRLILDGAIALTDLGCHFTGITELDVSKNTALTSLDCDATDITSLDVSKNTALVYLGVNNNSLAWLHIGDNSSLNSPWFEELRAINLGAIYNTFNIREIFPGIDPNRIQSINGASLDKTTGIVSGYADGTPITYTYDCGTADNGTVILDVTLEFVIKRPSSIIINDNLNKVYDGQAVTKPTDIEVTGSTGAVSIEWYTADDKKLDEAPVNAGSYKVKAILAEDADYVGAEVEKTFEIFKAKNTWTQELTIQNWIYGETANVPSAKAQFGIAEFTYSATEDGVYTADVPSAAGTYWVKATVTGINNYEDLEAKKSFTIEKASSTITIDNDLNKLFDGTAADEPQVRVTGSTGTVSIEWYQKEETTTKAVTWKKLAAAPSAVGEYKVVVTVGEDGNYIETTKEQEFSILENKIAITIPGIGGVVTNPDGTTGPSVTPNDKLESNGPATINPDGSIVFPNGGMVTKPDGSTETIQPGGVLTPNKGEEVPTPGTGGTVGNPDGTTGPSVTPNDKLESNGPATINPDGSIVFPNGGIITKPDGSTEVIQPGGILTPNQVEEVPTPGIGGVVTNPDGTTGPSVTLNDKLESNGPATINPDGSIVFPNGGTVIRPDGSTETIQPGGVLTPNQVEEIPTPGTGGVVTNPDGTAGPSVTPDDKLESNGAVTINPDGSIVFPNGGTVIRPDGSTETIQPGGVLTSNQVEVIPGTGGETTTTPAQGVTGVQTGDSTQAGLWTMLVGLSTGLMMYFRKKNRKEEV